ncbi:hypothetical protein BMIN_0701 [Bifidobacterium minimum]|uniref:Uncharacterized protein n=1 Tax=Bifidobacterium minimum TaxID=1693 RepID=A0A087BPN8_9BIFI|nr:hypothetical protein BMIN_0701 [Bifidobacterium minimum]
MSLASDHPRECGANGLAWRVLDAQFGSSPRVRGKRFFFYGMSDIARIIPASAGQTHVRRVSGQNQSDHPRECGANHRLLPFMSFLRGSSPRVRGKHVLGVALVGCVRIIPASAGQTLLSYLTPDTAQDHPRECGANVQQANEWMPEAGSSPRVRGKPCRSSVMRVASRIIPASAGQTLRTLPGYAL